MEMSVFEVLVVLIAIGILFPKTWLPKK